MDSGNGFSWEDTATEVLARLARAGLTPILVGGQAVNFWAEYFRSQEPSLAGAPFTSKDVDVVANRAQAAAYAKALAGKLRLPDIDHATPETGRILFVTSTGQECELDCLHDCLPNTHEFIRDTAVEFTYDWGKVRVMHPLASMQTRVYNVVKIAWKYDKPHGVRQLHASIVALRRFVWMLLEEGRAKAARKLVKQIYRYSLTSTPCRLFREKGIDTFAAVAPHPLFAPQFQTECLSRWTAHVAAKRAVSG